MEKRHVADLHYLLETIQKNHDGKGILTNISLGFIDETIELNKEDDETSDDKSNSEELQSHRVQFDGAYSVPSLGKSLAPMKMPVGSDRKCLILR